MSDDKSSARVTYDAGKVSQEVKKNIAAAQKKLDAAVLGDSNKYCPMQTGVLKDSGINTTDIGSGRVSWETPYARAQYYGYPEKRHNKNPHATGKWFETAKASRLKDWERIVNEGYREADK